MLDELFRGQKLFTYIFIAITAVSLLIILFIFFRVSSVFRFASKQLKKDMNAPRETVDAKVLSKRASHGRRMSSTYFVTFELDNGERIELLTPGRESGLLIEGDYGNLVYQGRYFVAFVRK